VCSSWAAAAAAATVEVDVPRKAISAFQPWLQQHAGQLVSLRGSGSWCFDRRGYPALRLPCGQLQQLSRLDLSSLELQLDTPTGSSSSTVASAPMLPRLQQIKLYECRPDCSTLIQPAQLSGVTRLRLAQQACHSWKPQFASDGIRQQDVKLMLQGLPNLAHLSLEYSDAYTDRSCLGLPALPGTSLTGLTLEHAFFAKSTWADSPSRLVCLQKLKLRYAAVGPMVIASLSRLTRLQLVGCWVPEDDSLSPEEEEADAMKGAAALLAAIGGLRQLQHLELKGERDCLLRTGQPADCAALTASSQLTHLQVYGWEGQPLPCGAVQHMFPAGRQRSQLQQLVLRGLEESWSEGPYITTADLHSIVSACPALRCLGITGVLAAGADVSALLQLPSTCASLLLGGSAVGDEAAAEVAQLTQLTALEWSESSSLTDAGLQLLTALQALETLCVAGSDDYAPRYESLVNSGGLELTTGDKVRPCRPSQAAICLDTAVL
jgi:hypothetical protein